MSRVVCKYSFEMGCAEGLSEASRMLNGVLTRFDNDGLVLDSDDDFAKLFRAFIGSLIAELHCAASRALTDANMDVTQRTE